MNKVWGPKAKNILTRMYIHGYLVGFRRTLTISSITSKFFSPSVKLFVNMDKYLVKHPIDAYYTIPGEVLVVF